MRVQVFAFEFKVKPGDGGDDHDSDDHNGDACVDVAVSLAAFVSLVEGKTMGKPTGNSNSSFIHFTHKSEYPCCLPYSSW